MILASEYILCLRFNYILVEKLIAGRMDIQNFSTVGQRQEECCCVYLACIWYVIMTCLGVCWIMLHSEFST